jgi:hypothetical protein
MTSRILAIATSIALLATPAGAQGDRDQSDSLRFVVVGHPRGNSDRELNPKLGELIEAVRRVRPEYVVLTGDIIYGEYRDWPPDSAHVERQWHALDSAFATLGVPVYRVPGNHDIHDPITHEIWTRRYGPLPRAIDAHGYRFLMLNSAQIRPAADTAPRKVIRGVDIDSAQIAFLRRELQGDSIGRRTFIFLHHLLWWDADGAWWRDVHPVLAAAGVRAVFTGDYGPLKFSTDERDGVRYYQTSIDDNAPVDIQRAFVSSRLLSSQFDNFLEVVAYDDTADVRVHVIGEISSGQFTPQHHAAASVPWPPRPILERLRRRPRLVAGAGLGGLLVVSLAFAAGRYSVRRRLRVEERH